MKFNDIITRIPTWYAARRCVYLKSAPGRGKTSVLASSAGLLSRSTGKDMGVVIINGPLLNPPDSIGYLVPRKVTSTNAAGETREHMESAYTDPFWFRTREGKRIDEYDGGVIVVDEADKMDVDMKKVIGEAALSGRLGPHTLPDGWVVWMAGNRQKDRSGSTKELDHLINRRIEIDVEDDIASWTDWANKTNLPAIYRSFANAYIQVAFTSDVPEKQGPWCTPRSLSEAGFYHDLLPKDGEFLPTDQLAMEEIAGQIGDNATGQLFSHIQLEREMPSFASIVKDPKGAPMANKADAQMLVAFNLAHRVDLDTIDPVCEYMERMPKEFGVVFGKAAVDKNVKLISSKGMMQWIKNNSNLMAQINNRAK